MYTKNRTRKAQGALLYFDKRFHGLFLGWLKYRMKQPLLGNYVFCNTNGSAFTSTQMTTRIRKLCQLKHNYFIDGTPRRLRFLQSAHIWTRHQQGLITQDQMLRLCKMFDRSLETWETSYAFSNDTYDRNPGEDNLNLLWLLETTPNLNELAQLNQIAVLQNISERFKTQINGMDTVQISRKQQPLRKARVKKSELFERMEFSGNESEESLPSLPSCTDIVSSGKHEIEDMQKEDEEDVITPGSSSPLLERRQRSASPIGISEGYTDTVIMDPAIGIIIRNRDMEVLMDPDGLVDNAVVSGSMMLLYHKYLSPFWGQPLESIEFHLGSEVKLPTLQHVNDVDGNHWFLLYIVPMVDHQYNFTVYVYDSLNKKSLSPRTKQYLNRWLGRKYQIGNIQVQQQPDGSSCGLFTVAFAVELAFAYGKECDLSQVRFDVSQMREHLRNCLLNKKLVPFPREK